VTASPTSAGAASNSPRQSLFRLLVVTDHLPNFCLLRFCTLSDLALLYAVGGYTTVTPDVVIGRGVTVSQPARVQSPIDGDHRHKASKSRSEGRKVRVLVVEDDEELAENVAVGLRRADMAVDVSFEGRSALERALVNSYDVIVLDRDLPLLHGDRVCEELRANAVRARILMLTASGSVDDRVEGLGLGADDYLPKPFAFAELIARVRALARRAQPAVGPLLVRGDLVVDSAKHAVERDGRTLELGPKEFAVLQLLLEANGRVVSAEELLERVWDDATDPFTSSVKVTISRLRAKLGEPPLIETVSRTGYKI
jgi:DNA-binding response OmpR family regulator